MSGRTVLTRLDANGQVPATVQTRLASFLISAHGAQARMLAGSLLGPVANPFQLELHAQFCREMEIVSLLQRATRWVPDSGFLVSAWRWEMAWMPHPPAGARDAMEGLTIDAAAFGHTLHTVLRPATLLPEKADPASPFVLALHRLEFESGRLLQAQSLLLKSETLMPVRAAVLAALEYRRHQIAGLWAELVAGLE